MPFRRRFGALLAAAVVEEGVLLAMGYPPDHATPSLDADRWMDWRNRIERTAVDFSNGVVTGIR